MLYTTKKTPLYKQQIKLKKYKKQYLGLTGGISIAERLWKKFMSIIIKTQGITKNTNNSPAAAKQLTHTAQ